MKIRKRAIVRIVAFTIAAFIGVGGFWFIERKRGDYFQTEVENYYSSALNELVSYLSNIEVNLEKGMYTGTYSQMSYISAQSFREASAAKINLSKLPLSTENTDGIYRFLSQVGNFSLYLSRKLASGDEISQEERDSLRSMRDYAAKLSNKFADIGIEMLENDSWNKEVKEALSKDYNPSETSALYKSIEDIKQTVIAYPKLIYDGPFSDHMISRSPKLVQGMKEISTEKAARIAANTFNCMDSQVKREGDEKGNLDCFIFSYNEYRAAITKKGGYLLYMNKTGQVDEKIIDTKKAVKTASEYVQSQYDRKFETSYYVINENVCTVNFAYTYDDIICYSDLIKVGIDMSNGDIVNVEATGFIMNHRKRSGWEGKYNAIECKKSLSKLLTVKSVNKCIILSEGQNEIQCYEFICKGEKGEDILVYINAKNKQEANILKIIETDAGTLTR